MFASEPGKGHQSAVGCGDSIHFMCIITSFGHYEFTMRPTGRPDTPFRQSTFTTANRAPIRLVTRASGPVRFRCVPAGVNGSRNMSQNYAPRSRADLHRLIITNKGKQDDSTSICSWRSELALVEYL